MNAIAGGMKCTYIDPRATITACKATRYWQVRPNRSGSYQQSAVKHIIT